MGQRLVVTESFGEQDFTIYFHWSAYTDAALEKARDLIQAGEGASDFAELVNMTLDLLSQYGGGIQETDEEIEAARELGIQINGRFCQDRNCGILNLTDNGKEQSRRWSEGDLYLMFHSRRVNCQVFFFYEGIDEIKQEYLEFDDDELPAIYHGSLNPEEFSFDEIDSVIEEIEEAYPGIIEYDGYYYSLIC